MKHFFKITIFLIFVNIVFAQNTIKEEVKKYLQMGAIVIDVRTPEEFAIGHFKNALNIPYDQMEARIKELESYKNKPIIVYCRSGRRSGIAKEILNAKGFKNVLNGINLSYFPIN